MIKNWAKVNSNLKWLMIAYDNPYFDLLKFCNNKNLNYRDVVGFINIGKSIKSGDLDISSDLKSALAQYDELVKQLEMISV